MNILITGGSGFLGTALTERLLAAGHKVYSISRHPPEPREGLFPIYGDILKPALGIDELPTSIDLVHHLAAIHDLGEDKSGKIWETNVLGTVNVIEFCRQHKIGELAFTSTAYTQGRNTYEQSKAMCETLVRESGLQWTIFKPSIIMGTPQHFFSGHFAQFIGLLIHVHRRAERVRRGIEETLRLPAIEPVFHVRGNPKGQLNVIRVDDVADSLASPELSGKAPATFWLTNPSPPRIEQIMDWVGEAINLNISLSYDFKPMPIEAMFSKLSRAFTPYLWGDAFPCDIVAYHPIDKLFIQDTALKSFFDD